MTREYDVAVVGATGAVGETIIAILEERDFPVKQLFPVTSVRSAGSKLQFRSRNYTLQDLETFDFSQAQIALFSAGASVSAAYAPKAAAAGCVVIDNSAHFRYEDDIPLVVAEVNPDAIAAYKKRGIIANPNCSTIQMLVALKPIYDAVGLERINVCTYQAVSGTGKKAIDELASQTVSLLNLREIKPEVYPRQIAFNALPQIDVFQDNGYTREEMKMVWETQKIFADNEIRVNPTAVRIPVFYGHSEALHIETRKKISAEQASQLMQASDAIVVLDERVEGGYATAVTEAAGTDPVYVSRIREDISHPRGLDMWVVADNVRKGAALNSVQIAELLIREYL